MFSRTEIWISGCNVFFVCRLFDACKMDLLHRSGLMPMQIGTQSRMHLRALLDSRTNRTTSLWSLCVCGRVSGKQPVLWMTCQISTFCLLLIA